MKNQTSTLNPLSKSIALALGATAISPVMAQDADTDDEMMMEEVMVSGVRRSLIDATAIKRDSDGVVDAISAEDIGKFPDTNLAEALQRITDCYALLAHWRDDPELSIRRSFTGVEPTTIGV